jgi:tetratricopeptide (TPR) repeat protein
LFRDALRLDSTCAPAKLALSKALLTEYQQAGKHDEVMLSSALALADEAGKSDRNNADAHAVLAEAYRYKQQFAKARQEVNAGLTIQPANAQCLRELAFLSLIQGNLDEALKNADAAAKIDPLHYSSQTVKGIVQLYREQFEDASKLFDHASELGGPDSLLTVKYKFRVWLKLEQEVRVISFCQQMMGRADDRTKLLLYYWIGRAHSLNGKLQESNANYDQGLLLADQVITRDPKDLGSLAAYALLQARRAKSPKGAVQAIERAVMLDSTSAKLHYYKARIHAIQNDKVNALSELTKAVALQYNFSDILDPDFLSVWQDPGFKAAITRK